MRHTDGYVKRALLASGTAKFEVSGRATGAISYHQW
jgi:hypothetical protein